MWHRLQRHRLQCIELLLSYNNKVKNKQLSFFFCCCFLIFWSCKFLFYCSFLFVTTLILIFYLFIFFFFFKELINLLELVSIFANCTFLSSQHIFKSKYLLIWPWKNYKLYILYINYVVLFRGYWLGVV